jgi:hypothetical protein
MHATFPAHLILRIIKPLFVVTSPFHPLNPSQEDSERADIMRKHLGENERRFISEGKKEHLVRRYPGNARSSF